MAWSKKLGHYGCTVRLKRRKDGRIYGYWTQRVNGEIRYPERCLHDMNAERAIRWGEKKLQELLSQNGEANDCTPTIARIFYEYLTHHSPHHKTEAGQRADQQRAELFVRFFGSKTDVRTVTLRSWEQFTRDRLSGAIDARGLLVSTDSRRTIRNGTVRADLNFWRAVMTWATRWVVGRGNTYLLDQDPTRGFEIPHERNPRRNLSDYARTQKVMEAAEQVKMRAGGGPYGREIQSYLPGILGLAVGTGRRINSILALRYSDLKLDAGHCGAIRWRAENDKTGKESTTPMGKEVRRVVDRIMRERPGVGDGFLFPAVRDPSRHLRVEVASEWLLQAEKLAGVTKLSGTLWHAYRRAWATSRKHLAAADVAEAGGWSDQSTLRDIYQIADAAGMELVMDGAIPIRRALQ